MNIRKIKKEDNPAVTLLIQKVMSEFKADPATTVLGDPTLHKMYETYQQKKAVYFVAEENGKLLGGAGIRQLDGSEENICELQRMFLLPEARGKGLGRTLMQQCLQSARESGYSLVYLETLSQMKNAISLYEKSGFKRLVGTMGKTGHGGCNIFMALEIK